MIQNDSQSNINKRDVDNTNMNDEELIENTPQEEHDPERVTYIGQTNYHNAKRKFGIKNKDRTRHTYIIGKTGMGKSTLLENMAIQDILNGEGVCFIDPHGSSAEKLLSYVPEHRLQDVIYFNPSDMKYPISLNVLEITTEERRHLVSSGLMNTFKRIFADQFSGRMSYLLNNAILSLLENSGESLLGINRIFADKDYRKHIISNVKDPAVRAYWEEEFNKYTDKYIQEAAPAIQNKIGQFISNPLIRNIVGQEHTSFDIRKIMDERKILICNLSLGLTGKDNVDLLGSLLVTKIYLAALSRADLSYEDLQKAPPFYLYVDEFQNFVNESFADILSQARKYNLGLTIAHQYIEQLDDETRAAIFGNVGTMIVFRVGATDAEHIEKEFAPIFTADDIVNLASREVMLRLSIDNISSNPFSASTLPPIENDHKDNRIPAITLSRAIYGKPKFMVEDEIRDWYRPMRERERDKMGEVDIITQIKNDNNKAIIEKKLQENNNPVREHIKKEIENRINNNSGANKPQHNNYNNKTYYNDNNNRKSEPLSAKMLNVVSNINKEKDYVEKNKENTNIENKSNNNQNNNIKNNKPNYALRDALLTASALNIKSEDKSQENKKVQNKNNEDKNNENKKPENPKPENKIIEHKNNENKDDKAGNNRNNYPQNNIKEVNEKDIQAIFRDII